VFLHNIAQFALHAPHFNKHNASLTNLGGSLHGMSGTRWSERVNAVKPIAAHTGKVLDANDEAKDLTLTPNATVELESLKHYFSSYASILVSSIWIKIISAIDDRNKILQARAGTVDVEVSNVEDLLNELKSIRDQWCKYGMKRRLLQMG
jgi:hypothetical protein